MALFEYQQTVRFQHCDPAGIVFYPRYLEMVNACVEAWFEKAVGVSFATLHTQWHVGVPTVSLQTRFVKASCLEDRLTLRLKIQKLGNTSLVLQVMIMSDEELRVENTVTLVLVDLKRMKSVAWSSQPHLQQRLQRLIT